VTGFKIDAPRDVRSGEELDLARLGEWLRGQQLLHHPLSLEQFPRGHSNLTYLLRLGGRELILRRPPFGSTVKTAHDMGREARILEKLNPAFPLAPRVVARCDDAAVLGAPFYLMEPIRGVILRRASGPPEFTAEQMSALCDSFVCTLATLHGIDWRTAGLEGKPEGFARRQVEGWTKRWQDAKTEEIPDLDAVARWLGERIPATGGEAFIHNDYKFDNLVISPDEPSRIIGVLDWEMATAGDPLMDLGTALGYWVEETDAEPLKAFSFGPTFAPGAYTRARLVDEYARLTGREVSGILFYSVFALFKIAVILQQIFKRYVEGKTHDERFAALGMGVQLLTVAATGAIARGGH
jgi:aminoglycoside phosphotransferase (APT) family kinase protein